MQFVGRRIVRATCVGLFRFQTPMQFSGHASRQRFDVQPKQVASDRVEVLCGDIAAFGLRESGLQRVCESEAKENAR